MSETTEEIIWEGSQSQVLNFGIFILTGIISLIIIVLSLMFFPLAAILAIIPLCYMFIKEKSMAYDVVHAKV